jgi:vacuolar-type H+-ATPase catalytic subunit A/Vma1
LQTKSREKLKGEIAELQRQLDISDRQVYETLLVTELNNRLKQDSAADKEIGDTDIQAYYDDYANKLKLLNPAAKVPDITVVTGQIRAILAEEKLIKELEKKNKVAVEEERFQKLFGDAAAAGDTVLQDNTVK